MTKEISVNLMCIKMRSGVTIWMEKAKAEKLQDILDGITNHKFIRYEGQSFNTADLEGVYDASTMDAFTRRRNGQWQCVKGAWHDRHQECGCGRSQGSFESPEVEEISEEQRAKNIKAIGKIRKGLLGKRSINKY